MSDLIDRQAAIDAIIEAGITEYDETLAIEQVKRVSSAQSEQHEIGYSECANAMLKMWIDNVLTDGEYNRIMDKLNAHWVERREE